MSSCRSCQEPIRWVESASTGTPMPLNRDPHQDGNIYIGHVAGDEVAIVLTGEELRQARVRNDHLYLSHFVNCPQAAEHRKPKAVH